MNAGTAEQVLIVGAGPAGMVLANELARRQVPCRLIDKNKQPIETSRSFTLHARTMEMFEHMGIAHTFLDDSIPSNGFYFSFIGRDEHPTLDFRGLASRYPYVLVYNQNDTERRLREHLDATYDIRPEWGTELKALGFADGQFTVELTRRDGNSETAHPHWVVGCDGIHSFVRKAMGLEFEGENYEGMVMQMMDVRYEGFPGGDDWVHYYMAKENFLLVTKLPSGNHRVLISDMGEADDDNLSPRESFQRMIDGHIQGSSLAEPVWATKWTIWKRLATDYRNGQALLAGDAAHVHSPSGGQGMNIGMQDAFNLGWKLAMVIRGEAKQELLDSYGLERQPIGAQAIAGTDAMHDIIMAHGHGLDDRLQLTKQAGWHDEAVNRISGLSYTYRDVVDLPPGLGSLDGLPPGDRAPDVRLSGHTRLFDVLRHPRFTLLLIPNNNKLDSDLSRQILERLDRHYPSIIKAVVIGEAAIKGLQTECCFQDDSGEFATVYGDLDAGHMYLIRPDGYIGLHALLDGAGLLFEYLQGLFISAGGEQT